MTQTETYLSVSKFAKRFNYNSEYVRRLIREGIIRAERFTTHGNYRIPLSQPFVTQTESRKSSEK